jgi:hypothetical protein
MKFAVLIVTSTVSVVHAGVVQVPEGGKPVVAIAKGVICGPLSGGWVVEGPRTIVPPPANLPNLARTLEVKIADTAAGCTMSTQYITVVALGPWPEIDPAGVTLWPDDGRVELRGQRLKGVQVAWSADGKTGSDACLDAPVAKVQTCAIPVKPGLATDVQLAWLPPYGRFGADVVTFDALGNRLDGDGIRIKPSRVVLTRPLVQTTGLDVSSGARVMLAHPEAVGSVDCGAATCELVDHAVSVRGVPDPSTAVNLKLRLAPRVFVARGDAFDTTVATSVPILSCPLTVIAGSVIRDVDDPSAVVKLGCARDPVSLRWTGGGGPAEVKKVVKNSDGVFVLLHLDRVTAERVTISASRPDLDNTIVASATAKTETLPSSRISLELPGHGKIDFVPTNRTAKVNVSSASEYGRLVPITIEGAYAVSTEAGVTSIRAADSAEGFVSLRLAYRMPTLPGELAVADLAIVTERVQRAMREAAVPAPIGTSAYTKPEAALVEVVCGDTDGGTHVLKPGQPHRVPYLARGSCRVVLHRERLTAADGSQEITLDIDVTKPDGTPRPDAKLSEHMVLRPGATERVVPIKSAGLDEFDRIEIRVSHVIDESRYVVSNAAPTKPGLLAAQWSAIVDGGRLRLYATATIPAGLYRVNHPSGQLTLNFGVLSRLTTLNRQGKEGLFGLEFGVMGLGLAPQQSNVEFPVTLAIVAGLGFRVPLGQGAAIGIQAWVAREFRDGAISILNMDGSRSDVAAGPWSFIFGPSISFGNVGLNL